VAAAALLVVYCVTSIGWDGPIILVTSVSSWSTAAPYGDELRGTGG